MLYESFSGFKGVIIVKMEQLEERIILHVSMPKKEHTCPICRKKTIRVHDFQVQKNKHLKSEGFINKSI